MNWLRLLFRSSLGKKYIMAVSGCVLFTFVVFHLLGNLQVFLGPGPINRYAAFLQSTPEILWTERISLLIMVGLHIWSAAELTLENRAARPARYAVKRVPAASYASRTMFLSGLIIAAFITYHLLDFTAQVKSINLTGQDFHTLKDAAGRHDVYRMIVIGFSNGWVCGFYLLGVGLLCFHLSHGISSMFQSVGFRNKTYTPFVDGCAKVIAILLFLGYASIPVSVLLGWVK